MGTDLLSLPAAGSVDLTQLPTPGAVPWYKYLASKAITGAANSAQAMGEGANIEMGPQYQEDNSLQPGELAAKANQAAIGNPNPQPSTPWLKYPGAGIEAVAGAGPLGVINPAFALGTFGSGVGGEVGADAAKAAGGGAGWQAAGRLTGGLVGGGIGTGLPRMATAATKIPEAFAPYIKAGIDPTLAGDVTGKDIFQRAQAFAAQSPGGAGRVQGSMRAMVDQFGNSLEDTAANLGSSRTLQDAGSVLQDQGRNWLSRFKQGNAAVWSPVDGALSGQPVDVGGYIGALDKVSKTLEGAPATAKILQPSISRNLLDALKTDSSYVINAAGKESATLPWETVKGIRSRIGEMLSDPNLPADSSTAELRRVYAGLSKDMETAATAQSPETAAAFKAANGYTKQGHDFIENVLTPIVKDGQTPEGAASSILGFSGKGGSKLNSIRQEMPEAADELAAFKIRDMGLATPGAQNATGSKNSLASFLTDWNNMAPEAKSALFANPATHEKMQALAEVASRGKATAEFLNTSKTGPYLSIKALGELPKDIAIGAFAGHEAAGIPGAIAGGLGGSMMPFAPGILTGRMAATPALTRLLATPGNPGTLVPSILAGQTPSILSGQ